MTTKVKGVLLEVLGWTLVVAGVAALVLPGPGLLMIFAGMAVLSQRYEWAERRLRPIEIKAMRGAAESVQTKPRVALSCLFAVWIMGCGLLWFLKPDQPSWWRLPGWTWLPGGRATGVTLMVSSLLAVGLIVWSYRRFHGKPEEVAMIEHRAARSRYGVRGAHASSDAARSVAPSRAPRGDGVPAPGGAPTDPPPRDEPAAEGSATRKGVTERS